MRTLLLRRLAPVLALLAVVGTACSAVDSPAVSVNGTKISTESVRDELKVIRENDAYRSALEQAYQVELAGAGKGTFSAAFTAQVLSLRVYYELLEQALADRGVRISDEDLEEASEVVEQQVASLGEGVLEGFPEAYRDRLVRQEAIIDLASEEATKDVEVACVSHILVSTESRSEAEARQLVDDLAAQLDAGADFAELATANSEDPGSAERGGELGCGPPGRFVPEFDEAAFSQEVGEVGDPVQTDFGYHLILVTSREKGGEGAAEGGQAALNALVSDVLCDEDADIDVNQRYGRWDRTPCDEGQLPVIAPPRTSQSTP